MVRVPGLLGAAVGPTGHHCAQEVLPQTLPLRQQGHAARTNHGARRNPGQPRPPAVATWAHASPASGTVRGGECVGAGCGRGVGAGCWGEGGQFYVIFTRGSVPMESGDAMFPTIWEGPGRSCVNQACDLKFL